ncbi:hypothetical protein [Aquimarina litoralis]|uniref:hypothetical protein n=1 Tax=Aquimarina litoralis TaxID=584605 RepID=UPI001C593213|nr:hypothetical protein [Aquimarina litoralis]MBW1298309.1 hypothetical protein [Aquimarina litoralis]
MKNIIESYNIKKVIQEVHQDFEKILFKSKTSLIETDQFKEQQIDYLNAVFDKVSLQIFDVDLVIITFYFDVFFEQDIVGKYFKSFSSDYKECIDSEIYGCDPPYENRNPVNYSSLIKL